MNVLQVPLSVADVALENKIPMQKKTWSTNWFRRNGLLQKYVVAFVGLAVLVLAMNSAFETWFAYRETVSLAIQAQSERATATARRIERSMNEIERQISWATRASTTTMEQRRADYQLLLQQVPAIDRLIQLDSNGKEILRVSRQEAVVNGGTDYSLDRRFTSTQSQPVWFSPVYFDGLDPYLTIAMLHAGRQAGSTVAELNLSFLAAYVDKSQVSNNNYAYVVGPVGRLIAHTDPSRALGADFRSSQVAADRHAGRERRQHRAGP